MIKAKGKSYQVLRTLEIYNKKKHLKNKEVDYLEG